MQGEAEDADHARARLPRRHMLRLLLAASLTTLPGVAQAARWRPPREWRLRLYNTATGEDFDDVYCVNGRIVPEAMARIDWLLRDHYCDQCISIDDGLVHRLYELQCRLDGDRPFEVLSGYRTPETNSQLIARGLRAAPKSLHMEGRAIDIRLPGVKAKTLYRAALASGEGGSGWYPRRGFVHVDSGPPRQWVGR